MKIKNYMPIPFLYHTICRIRLKNKTFSLFTGNCMAGIIYHNLGIKFQSPTINLRVDTNRDLCKMLLNLDYYLSCSVTEVKDDNVTYPCGMLGDIKLHFNHYADFEEACSKWEERKMRVNLDNLYVIATDWVNDNEVLSREEVEEFAKIPCKNLLVFTQIQYDDLPFTRFIGSERIKTMLLTSKISGLRFFERYFDYVGWLNTKH